MLSVNYTDHGPQVSYRDLPPFSLWLEPEDWPLLGNPEVEELATWLEPKTGTYGLNAEDCPLFRAAHLLYFRARGTALPDRYVPISARLGLEDSRLVYYLGRLATPSQIADELARPQPALLPIHRPGLELLVQTSGGSYRSIYGLVVRPNYFLINGDLHARHGKRLLNISERSWPKPLEGFRTWLHQQTLETLEELCRDLEQDKSEWLQLLYAYSHLPETHRPTQTWQREGQAWAITEDPDGALWLTGPGLIEKIWPFHKKRLGGLLQAGHLRPDDPSCAFWAVATSGASLPKGILRDKWTRAHQHERWLLLKSLAHQDAWFVHDPARKKMRPLSWGQWNKTSVVMPFIEAGALTLAALPTPVQMAKVDAYLGCVGGAHYVLGALGREWAIGSADLTPTAQQVIATGSREELRQRIVRNGLATLVATHQIARL
jgi:hypothetical protein